MTRHKRQAKEIAISKNGDVSQKSANRCSTCFWQQASPQVPEKYT